MGGGADVRGAVGWRAGRVGDQRLDPPGAPARPGHRAGRGRLGLAITGFGLAPDIGAALALLVLAGAADMVSGIFRGALWNATIPDSLRGRLAGVELLSYGLGPSAGQIRAGAVASVTTPRFSLFSGGLLCAGAVAAVCAALPGFVRYSARSASSTAR